MDPLSRCSAGVYRRLGNIVSESSFLITELPEPVKSLVEEQVASEAELKVAMKA